MSISIRAVEYFYTRVENEPRRAFELLARLAAEDIHLLAFSAIPIGQNHVELTMFPEQPANLEALITSLGATITGPQHAILIQGDDHLGALADIHRKLLEAGVQIYASSGVTDGNGRYGYVIYVKEGDHLAAADVLSKMT